MPTRLPSGRMNVRIGAFLAALWYIDQAPRGVRRTGTVYGEAGAVGAGAVVGAVVGDECVGVGVGEVVGDGDGLGEGEGDGDGDGDRVGRPPPLDVDVEPPPPPAADFPVVGVAVTGTC